jgi:antitoxin component YwqK of YwqJK toxin-antitoxin module
MEMAMGRAFKFKIRRMKTLLFIILAACLCFCQSQRTRILNTANCLYDTIISKPEMTFELKKYGLTNPKHDTILFDDNHTVSMYIYLGNGYFAFDKTNKETKLERCIHYYPSGKIRMSYFQHSNTELGKEIVYDESGRIEKITNHDKGYAICWAQALEIGKWLASKNIKKHGLSHIVLDRKEWNNTKDFKPEWTVSIISNEPLKKADYMQYIIDGVTGKLIKTRRAIESSDDILSGDPLR